MRKKLNIPYSKRFLEKALNWAQDHTYYCYLNPNDHQYREGAFLHVLAVGAKDVLECRQNAFFELEDRCKSSQDWWFGVLNYDLKKEIEGDAHPAAETDEVLLSFFRPEFILFFNEDTIEIQAQEPEALIKAIEKSSIAKLEVKKVPTLKPNMNQAKYLKKVDSIKNHILEGDVYELNLCMGFSADSAQINPLDTYLTLNQNSPMPFSALSKFDNQYIISASPERFFKKTGSHVVSQPIKGTRARGLSDDEDQRLKKELIEDEKELAENMMIVDLVRNDLARTAKSGSIKVDKIFEVYSFKQVHQLISTISAELKPEVSPFETLRLAFPMGSMTGAPKIMAMHLIDQLEPEPRGSFSGALGYINPQLDMDFSVLIRSIFYDELTKKIRLLVGSAITIDAEPEAEYTECLLKAKAMFQVLGH